MASLANLRVTAIQTELATTPPLWCNRSVKTSSTQNGIPHRGHLIVLLVAALLLGAGSLLFVMRHASGSIASALLGRSVGFDTSLPVVVEKIQRLQRLETVVYSLDTVVEGDKTSAILPDFLFGDKLLLVVHGQTVAGIDLSQLTPANVQLSGSSIHVQLPAAEIFSTTLDNEHTRVYSRSTGFFVQADQNLETETRQKAEQQLQQAALDDGILDAAHKNAVATVTTMLSGLGFTQVDVK